MRDTELLRRRLWAQMGLPLATVTLLSACGGSVETPTVTKVEASEAKAPGKQRGDAKAKSKANARRGKARKTTSDSTPSYMPPARIEDIPEGEFDYFGPPRDPFTNHEEEQGCPSGDWCGAPDDARKFALEHVPEQLGCPAKIVAKPQVANSIDQKEKRWKGLSMHPMMQGRLMTSVTKDKRKEGEAEICCYHWFEYCSGRPLLDGEDMVVAELRAGSSWSCDPAEVAAPPDRPDEELAPELRARLGQLWVEDAQMEHASIGAFERATLELMAMAAPPELLGDIQAAAADEVDHAMACFGLAARFSGVQREPDSLPALEPRVMGLTSTEDPRADWIRLALDTFVEGCVGETIATLIARRGMRRCVDPATTTTLERIVEDESRHAGLAWRTLQWIFAATAKDHREAVVAALREQARAMAERAERACETLPEADDWAAELARFGRLDRRAELLARRDAWTELIRPTLEALVEAAEGLGPGARA